MATASSYPTAGRTDGWRVAEQIARRVKEDAGADVFIDVYDIAKGDDFEQRIFGELPACDELLVLLTPSSSLRNWVWVEIGAARALGKRVVAVLYGVSLQEIEKERGGATFLKSRNICDINELNSYFLELKARVGGQNGP